MNKSATEQRRLCDEDIPWSSLDDSVWDRIFSYVPLRTRVRTEVVCRRWCKAIRSKRLWSSLRIGTDSELSSKCGPAEMTALVSHSALGAPRKPLVNGLSFWARFSPIKEVDLTGVCLTTGSPIHCLHVLGHCKKLEILKMSSLKSGAARRPIFFLSKDFKKVNEFVLRAERLRCFQLDARVQSTWSSSSRQKWLDPWQWHTITQWLQSPIVRVVHLEIMNLPISTFAKLPNNRETYFEDYVHPFVNLQTLGDAIVNSQILSLSMGRGCLLGNEGVLLLVDSIKNNKSLHRLQIRHSQITSAGARKLAEALQKGCPPLCTLDLRFHMVNKDAAQNNPFRGDPETVRDAMFGVICDASVPQGYQRAVTGQLVNAVPANYDHYDMHHLLEYLKYDGLHPDHVLCVLRALLEAIQFRPELSEWIISEHAKPTWRKLLPMRDRSVQEALYRILSCCQRHRRILIAPEFMDLVINILEEVQEMDVSKWPRTALFAVQFLRDRFEMGIRDLIPLSQRLSRVILKLVMISPYELPLLQIAFRFVSVLRDALGETVHEFGNLIGEVLRHAQDGVELYIHYRREVRHLALGVVCSVAQQHAEYLQGVGAAAMREFENLRAVLEESCLPQEVRRDVVRETMSALQAEARRNVYFFHNGASLLFGVVPRVHWSYQIEMRDLLMETQPPIVRRAYALTACSFLQLHKVLRYHGVSQQTAERCNLDGIPFLQASEAELRQRTDCTPEELATMQHLQRVYRCMEQISHPNCRAVTNAEMESVLHSVPTHTHLREVIRSRCQDRDTCYYLDALMAAPEALQTVCHLAAEV